MSERSAAELPENDTYRQLVERGNEIARAELLAWASSCLSRRVRSLIEFAQEEVILPDDGGPFSGQPFDILRQPYVRLLYEEILSGRWSEIWICGPSQSGKTLCSFVILICYITCELRRNVGVCVPDENMISDKWTVDIQPVFAASPTMSQLLPTSGPGSRNGVVKESVRLTNGVMIKFYTPGGSDQSKAGFTSPYIVGTEAAGFSRTTANSKEADAIRQIRARQRSQSKFNEDGSVNTDRLMSFEGTVTVEEDLPWSMKAESSDSQITCQCVHCKSWVSIERDHFGGWETATTEVEAATSGVFHCPSCGEVYSSEDRVTMNQNAKLVHRGQSIDENGNVVGQIPPTSTLFFRWNAWNNLFLRESDFAVEEWLSSKLEPETPAKENAEKELCQFIWAIPYAPKLVGTSKLDANHIRQRTGLPPLVVPTDTAFVTAGIDIGRWWCWLYVIASRTNGTMQTVAAGRRATGLEVPPGGNVKHYETIAIQRCVEGILGELLETGFASQAGGTRICDYVFVDSNYLPKAAIAATRVFPRDRVMCVIGRGKSQMTRMKYEAPRKVGGIVRRIGEGYHVEFTPKRGWHIFFDADDSKLAVQAALRVEVGQPGSLVLPNGDPKDRALIARHMAAEIYSRRLDPVKGLVDEWKPSGQNHLLDCAGMAWVAQSYKGWRMPNLPRIVADEYRPTEVAPVAAIAPRPPAGRPSRWLSRSRDHG